MDGYCITEALFSLVNASSVEQLSVFVSKSSWSSEDRQTILNLIAKCLTTPQLTEVVADHFSPILLDLFFRLKADQQKLSLFCTLSKLIGYYVNATSFAYECFNLNLFNATALIQEAEKSGRLIDFFESTYVFLCFNNKYFLNNFDFSLVANFVNDSNSYVRWLAVKIYSIILNLDSQSTQSLISDVSDEDKISFDIQCYELSKHRSVKLLTENVIKYHKRSSAVSGVIYQCDFTKDVVSVYSVLLRRWSALPMSQTDFVVLPSIEENLRSLALGVSLERPILVEGEMGSGKSALLTHLARLTGRFDPPDVVTLQVSDQVDPKYLLGSYVCSNEPGEFIFNLGPLLKAIRDGSWLILEDINCATSDVISLVYSIIESKSLACIPGCENKFDRINPNFRIFFTKRIDSREGDASNYYQLSLLEKLSFKVTINSLNTTEVEQLILSRWLNLRPIVQRILNIYSTLTSKDLSVTKTKRIVTLRDLLKWCSRLSIYFKIDSDQASTFAFLDAIDCFIGSYSNDKDLIEVSNMLGENFNLSKSQCQHTVKMRQPEITISDSTISIGRQSIVKSQAFENKIDFAFTTQSLQLLEKLFVSVNHDEPVLLCGETGVGKTSCIQYLAALHGKQLHVINMNQQSNSVELFGGYKPIDIKYLVNSVKHQYQELFSETFDLEKNSTFLTKFTHLHMKQDWKLLLEVMLHICTKAMTKSTCDKKLCDRWINLQEKLSQIQKHLSSRQKLTFAFIDGVLTRAIKTGQWVLLDEINLAERETLQSLSLLLENNDKLLLFEKSTDQVLTVHQDFRLFACMNPATDVGKRDLLPSIQNRFTEFYISEVNDKAQLRTIVQTYIASLVTYQAIESIVNFYLQIKADAVKMLKDINGYRPVYSLRNLCRALVVIKSNPFQSIQRTIYEAFCLAFLSNLDYGSYRFVQTQIEKMMFKGVNIANMLKGKLQFSESSHVIIENYPITKGKNEIIRDETYILTATVKKNLQDICRIIASGKNFPILLQGETSVGKTSLITWLAKVTGNVCYRVNNHEHTDIQEYIGCYVSDSNGQIVFKEGILVEAMKQGYWIILDELNLAPTEVLEALNRVLDDNREVLIPETQEVVKAHSRFLLFATQNPPGRYGGRKVLSRAFRNRFIELNFSEIPTGELEEILHRKCSIPQSYAKRMVSVLTELQMRRSNSDIFAGKHGLITLRDLFRWGYRYSKFARDLDPNVTFYDWNQFLANQGFMLLAGRVRKPEEITLIKEILEKTFKCSIKCEDIFYNQADYQHFLDKFSNIVWTNSFKRLATLLYESIKFEEPVLLVGETGCGKTTICQLFAEFTKSNLVIVNCHMNTESSDFLGSLRPNRNLSSDSSDALFEWVDGPLIKSMKEGSFLLVDEISLADDSVLERLNSVLEQERTIFLAENNETPLIQAKPSFRYFATMNPGGDYGKRELSPALKDRFTEIWCPAYDDIGDIKLIITHNLKVDSHQVKRILCDKICDFIQWFDQSVLRSKRTAFSIRDILSWVNFINQTSITRNCLNIGDAFLHGAFLVFIDSIGTGVTMIQGAQGLSSTRKACEEYVNALVSQFPSEYFTLTSPTRINADHLFQFGSFYIERGNQAKVDGQAYSWNSCGVEANLLRIMRALQLDKPILLEGPPGVGKTSLVQALANATGHTLIRINLSDQTDIADLFGCDLPLEGENSAGKFAFRDGPLLTALKNDSTWILLDELNLASQTVLEGLNACLDHRGEIYIPELNRAFHINKCKHRIFASQNPISMDVTRKGLPKSFLNRFTVVYVDNLNNEDFFFILKNLFSSIDVGILERMISVNDRICQLVSTDPLFAKKGGPFEFNLRDLIRWAEVSVHGAKLFGHISPHMFFDLIYSNKMRTLDDQEKMKRLCNQEFENDVSLLPTSHYFTQSLIQFGYSFLKRRKCHQIDSEVAFSFEKQKTIIESMMKCVEMNWAVILIGATGLGKTFLVKLIAQLCGYKLNVLAVNSDMDTTDLLGGFEQKDLSQDLQILEEDVLRVCLCQANFQFQNIQMISKFLYLMYRLYHAPNTNASSIDLIHFKMKCLQKILDLFYQIEVDEIKQLQARLNILKQTDYQKNIGSFEWKDSILVKSIQNGEWLLIDNANFLNPSVLDRLNSLLENNGRLVINEKGSINGELVEIAPHRDFRLFLTMNPQHGELSRPMRNRGIEIVMPEEIDWQELSDAIRYRFGVTLHHECFESIDYNLAFKHALETLQRYQHGFTDQNNVSNSFITTKPLNLLNDLLNNSSLFYAKLDFRSLQLSQYEFDSLKVRIFLENSTCRDYHFRLKMLSSLYDNSKQLQVFKDIITFTISNMYSKYGDAQLDLINDLPIDFRENVYLSEAIKNIANLSDKQVDILHRCLNSFHLNFLWCDLKQRIGDVFLENFALFCENSCLKQVEPKFLLSIRHLLCELDKHLVIHWLKVMPDQSEYVLLRRRLIWLYSFLRVCSSPNNNIDLNRFMSREFFPQWFVFNEIATIRINDKLNELSEQINSFFNLTSNAFNHTKSTLISQLTCNYFVSQSEQDFQVITNFAGFVRMLKSTMYCDNQVALANELIFKNVQLLCQYMNHEIDFELANNENLSLIQTVQEKLLSNDEPLLVSGCDTENQLVESRLLLKSLFATQLVSYYQGGSLNTSHLVDLARNNLILGDPFLILCDSVLKNSKRYSDILLHFIMNLNESLNVNSIFKYFEKQNSRNGLLRLENADKLTFELMPLLSITCFNIYRPEQTTMEEFFKKKLTLNFYMNYFTKNYQTLKASSHIYFDKFINFALSYQNQFENMNADLLFQNLSLEDANQSDQVLQSLKLVSIGYWMASQTSIDFPIDPAIRSVAILKNSHFEIELTHDEMKLRCLVNQQKYGHHSELLHHGLFQHLQERMVEYERDMAQLKRSVHHRGTSTNYFALCSDLAQFTQTVFNWNRINSLCTTLINSYAKPSSESCTRLTNSFNYQQTLVDFVKHITEKYSDFSDLTTPFLTGVSFVLKGLQLLTYRLQVACNTHDWFALDGATTQQLFKQLFQFVSSNSPHEIADFIFQTNATHSLMNLVNKFELDEKHFFTSLLKSLFIEIENSMLLGLKKPHLFTLYLQIIDMFAQWWKNEKAQEELEQIKQQSLFHFKMEDTDPTDEQIKMLFPSFEHQFQDLIEDQCPQLADVRKEEPKTIELNISKETILFIIKSHLNLSELSISSSRHSVDLISPYIMRYQILADIYRKTLGLLDVDIEKELIDGHIVVNQRLLELEKNASSLVSEKPFNVYQESTLVETQKCHAILKSLKTKIVTELLPQFENHPALIKILQIVERIYCIDINSSLLSFATGLELILKASEDWQLIAHRGISLSEHLNQITELLVAWRTLEINYWAQCLPSISNKIEERELLTWWFHFYSTINDLVQQNNHSQAKEFISSLKKFIENSTLGQFSIRMALIHSFTYHLKCSHETLNLTANLLKTSLENIYMFYDYFRNNVTDAIVKECSPIEKEIKDYVKISRWNPNNFWSLKESLNKAHRQLYGYLRRYEQSLLKPAFVAFVFDSSSPVLRKKPWRLTLSFDSKPYSMSPCTSFQTDYRFLRETDQFMAKSFNKCRRILIRSKSQQSRVNALEDINIEIITELQALSKMNPSESKDLEKWKRQVGQIQTKKRRALSELFKTLLQIGLSYRKGNINYDTFDVNEALYTTEPLNEETYLQFDDSTQSNIASCNQYFYKCLAGLSTFFASSEKPNTQLTLDMIDRMKGFCMDLTRSVLRDRTLLSNSLVDFACVTQTYQQLIEKLSSESGCIVQHASISDSWIKLENLIVKIVAFVIRLNTIVTSHHSTSGDALMIEQHGDELSLINSSHLESISSDLQILLKEHDYSSCHIFTDFDTKHLKVVFKSVENCIIKLSMELSNAPEILKIYKCEVDYFQQEISGILTNLVNLENLFNLELETSTQSNSSMECCNLLIENVLISIQKVEEFCCFKKVTEKSDVEQKDLYKSIELFSISKVLKRSRKVKLLLSRLVSSINNDEPKCARANYQLLQLALSWIDVYINCHKHVFAISIGSLKTTNKLLHILLALFNDLMLNGFCLPPEPNQDPQSGSQLKDIQNSGFGQGDTSEAKDVSDRLDCQDQLDELDQGGDEQETDDQQSTLENEKNGIEMDDNFDGQDFGADQTVEQDNEKEEKSESEDDQFSDMMGDVESDEEVLDQKLWGDEPEEDNQDLDEKDDLNEAKGTGQEELQSQMVANDDNKQLDANKDEAPKESEQFHDDDQPDSEAINESTLEDQFNENESHGQGDESKPQPENVIELPEQMQLDSQDSEDEGDSSSIIDDAELKNETLSDDDEDGSTTNNLDSLAEPDVEMNEENAEHNLNANTESSDPNQCDNLEAIYGNTNSGNLEKPMESAPSDENEVNKESSNTGMNSNTVLDNDSTETSITSAQLSGSNEPKESSGENQSLPKNRKNPRSLAEEATSAKRRRIMPSEESKPTLSEEHSSDKYQHVDDQNKANDLAYDMAQSEPSQMQESNEVERGVNLIEEEQFENHIKECPEVVKNDVRTHHNQQEKEDENADDFGARPGETVRTMEVCRTTESYFNVPELTRNANQSLEFCLSEQVEPCIDISGGDPSLYYLWQECQRKIDPLLYELCNQLQLVLEPTKCSKFKGDFKSGKRLNMRKVIAYIASDFRKDKIWLRRVKPNKRQYQIIIAVDDSLSMSDSHSRQMAFESLLLLGKSLSIIESGMLSVLSFGEVVRVVHQFNEPFTDQSALKMFSKFQFDQTNTRIDELLRCSLNLFSKFRQNESRNGNVQQLLLIVSDGRGIFSEANRQVEQTIVNLKQLGIFVVFIIVDNPEHKNSILDIRVPIFDNSGKVRIESYIEMFPFPYYVILKDINSLPSILGEALRQWFELIANTSH